MIQQLLKLVLVGGLALPLGGCSFFIPEKLAENDFEDIKVCSNGAVVIRDNPDEPFPSCPDVDVSFNYKRFLSAEIENVHSAFTFSAEVPTIWKIEAIPEIESINIYDPNASGNNSLEQSQIFIRYFEADAFLTLDTVTIYSEDVSDILERPTVIYDIEKKAGVSDFTGQPPFRNERHTVFDIRESDDNPSIFYVFALNPNIDLDIFEHLLYSLVFDTEDLVHVELPIDEFFNRITKKPFGIYIPNVITGATRTI